LITRWSLLLSPFKIRRKNLSIFRLAVFFTIVTASFQVEHVIREEKMISAYELIELYSELIVARLSIIASQKYVTLKFPVSYFNYLYCTSSIVTALHQLFSLDVYTKTKFML
jgi:hypothetical protein